MGALQAGHALLRNFPALSMSSSATGDHSDVEEEDASTFSVDKKKRLLKQSILAISAVWTRILKDQLLVFVRRVEQQLQRKYQERGRPSVVPPLNPVQVPAYFQNITDRNLFLDICQDVLRFSLQYDAVANPEGHRDEALFMSVLDDTKPRESEPVEDANVGAGSASAKMHAPFHDMIHSCMQSPPERTKLEQALLYVRTLQLTVQYKLWNESPIALFPASSRQMLFELDVVTESDGGHDQNFRDIRRREQWPNVEDDENENRLSWVIDLLQHDVQSALFFADKFDLELDSVRQEQVRLLYLRNNDGQAQAIVEKIEDKHQVGTKMLAVARLRLCSILHFMQSERELEPLTALIPPETLRWINRTTEAEEFTLEHLENLITSPEIAILQLKATRILLTHTAACVTARSNEARQATAMGDICKELLSHMQNM